MLGFAAGCVLSGSYGFLAGAWPFGFVEAIWAAIVYGGTRSNRSHRVTSAGSTAVDTERRFRRRSAAAGRLAPHESVSDSSTREGTLVALALRRRPQAT